jgi:hypothetical protein
LQFFRSLAKSFLIVFLVVFNQQILLSESKDSTLAVNSNDPLPERLILGPTACISTAPQLNASVGAFVSLYGFNPDEDVDVMTPLLRVGVSAFGRIYFEASSFDIDVEGSGKEALPINVAARFLIVRSGEHHIAAGYQFFNRKGTTKREDLHWIHGMYSWTPGENQYTFGIGMATWPGHDRSALAVNIGAKWSVSRTLSIIIDFAQMGDQRLSRVWALPGIRYVNNNFVLEFATLVVFNSISIGFVL